MLRFAAVLALVTGVNGLPAVLTYALGAFVAATVVQEFARGARARGILHGEAPLTAVGNLFRRNGRRYGGYVVHLGIVLVAVAVATSQAGSVDAEKTLAPGETLVIGHTVHAALDPRGRPRRLPDGVRELLT